MSYSAYIFINHEKVKEFVRSNYIDCEKEANDYVRQKNLKDASVWVEDTTDKYE